MKTNKFFWVIAMIAFMVPEMAQEIAAAEPEMAQEIAAEEPEMAQEIAAEEPVIITAPDTTIEKTDYTLSEQGITIAVSYGSAYPADHAYNNIDVTYFGVLANGSMTISAGENIRGIAVNGWAKQNFSASCDYGNIDYISDDAADAVGEPVLTISDINHTSVTISCDKQLRCFSIEVYFSENPDAPQEEATDTVRLEMVRAVAQDYSEDTTYSSEGAYSYWLMLAPEAGYPEVWLDLYAAVKGDLSGEYSLYNYNVGDYTYVQLGASSLDYEYAYDQEFTITKSDSNYRIEGYVIAKNDVQYEFVFEGPVSFVKEGDDEGVENVEPDSLRSVKILQDGQLLILRNGRRYTVLGI